MASSEEDVRATALTLVRMIRQLRHDFVALPDEILQTRVEFIGNRWKIHGPELELDAFTKLAFRASSFFVDWDQNPLAALNFWLHKLLEQVPEPSQFPQHCDLRQASVRLCDEMIVSAAREAVFAGPSNGTGTPNILKRLTRDDLDSAALTQFLRLHEIVSRHDSTGGSRTSASAIKFGIDAYDMTAEALIAFVTDPLSAGEVLDLLELGANWVYAHFCHTNVLPDLEVGNEFGGRVYERFSHWKAETYERVRNCQERESAEKASDLQAKAQLGRYRSTWLDTKYSEPAHSHLSDKTLNQVGGPTYNTIRAWRKGITTTQTPKTRRDFATAFKIALKDVPE